MKDFLSVYHTTICTCYWEDFIFFLATPTLYYRHNGNFEVTQWNSLSFSSLCCKLYSFSCYRFGTVMVWNGGSLTGTPCIDNHHLNLPAVQYTLYKLVVQTIPVFQEKMYNKISGVTNWIFYLAMNKSKSVKTSTTMFNCLHVANHLWQKQFVVNTDASSLQH